MSGFHHLRKRVRTTKGLEPFPSNIGWKRILDYAMYVVGLAAPLALLPQILQIFGTRSAAGISLVTWLLLSGVTTMWTLYGAAHHDRQIFLANLFMTLFNLTVVVGVLLYS